MVAWLRRFPVSLGILLGTTAVFPPVLLYFNVTNALERVSRAETQKQLQVSAAAVETRLLGMFRLLRASGRETADAIGSLHVSAADLPSAANAALARAVANQGFEVAVFIDLDEKPVTQYGTVPSEELLALLKPELRGVGDAGVTDGVAALNGFTFVYVVLPMLRTENRGWLVVGNLLKKTDLAELSELARAPVSLVRYRAGDSWAWNVVGSSWEDAARVNMLSSAGAGRTDGTAFTQNWKGQERLHHARKVGLEASGSPLGIVLDLDVFSEAARDSLAEIREFFLLGITLALALAGMGGILLSRLADTRMGEALSELGARASSVDTGPSLELEQRVYDLERKAYELSIVNRIYKTTNFKAGLFDVLTEAAEVLMIEFGVSNAFLYRKAPDSTDLALIFVKRRLQHSGQIVTSKEANTLLLGFPEDSLAAVESEAKNSIASGRLHRCEIPRAEGQAPIQAVALPVTFAEGVNGALCLVPEAGEFFFTEGDAPLLENLAALLTDILGVARLNDTTVLDPLTRLYNFRHFQNQIAIEAMRARRSSGTLAMLAIEIDDFKQFAAKNETRVAEEVVKDVAALLRTLCRTTDFLARKEGGLFLVLLPETNPAGAAVVTEKIRVAVENNVTSGERGPVRVTVSIGVAFFPAQAMVPKDLQNLALEALANAKEQGGNRAISLKLESHPGAPV